MSPSSESTQNSLPLWIRLLAAACALSAPATLLIWPLVYWVEKLMGFVDGQLELTGHDLLLIMFGWAVTPLTWLVLPSLTWLILHEINIHPFLNQAALSAFKLHLKVLVLLLSLLILAGMVHVLVLLIVNFFSLDELLGMAIMLAVLPAGFVAGVVAPVMVLSFYGFTASMFINGALRGRLYRHPRLPFTPKWLRWLDT